jgi:hypothetical protein
MIAFRDFEGARESFVKAMKFSTESVSDQQIILKNFNELLRVYDKNKDAFDEFRREQL